MERNDLIFSPGFLILSKSILELVKYFIYHGRVLAYNLCPILVLGTKMTTNYGKILNWIYKAKTRYGYFFEERRT